MELSKTETTRNRCIALPRPAYITCSASVVGPKEESSHFSEGFDKIFQDPFIGKKNWEDAESELQRQALLTLLHKAGLEEKDIDCIFSGDLLSQTTASSYGLVSFGIPNYGIYGACSNCGATLALGAIVVATGCLKRVVAMTSSHFGSAEKEFRFPLGYGTQRPLSATWTVTGSGAFLLEQDKKENAVLLSHAFMGEIVDPGIKDVQNMGACMAPAAALTISSALKDGPYRLEDYDQIVTGDLGEVGATALYDLMALKGYDIQEKHTDCGLIMFDREKEDVHAGGSGCGCSATMLAAYVMPKLISGEWKRVLFVPTGALLSKTRSEESMSIPCIAHGVLLEHSEA